MFQITISLRSQSTESLHGFPALDKRRALGLADALEFNIHQDSEVTTPVDEAFAREHFPARTGGHEYRGVTLDMLTKGDLEEVGVDKGGLPLIQLRRDLPADRIKELWLRSPK